MVLLIFIFFPFIAYGMEQPGLPVSEYQFIFSPAQLDEKKISEKYQKNINGQYNVSIRRNYFPLIIDIKLYGQNNGINHFDHSKMVINNLKKDIPLPTTCHVNVSFSHPFRNSYELEIYLGCKKESKVFFPFKKNSFLVPEKACESTEEFKIEHVIIYDCISSNKKKDISKKIKLEPPTYSSYYNMYVLKKKKGFFIFTARLYSDWCSITKKNFLEIEKPKVYVYFLSSLEEKSAQLIHSIPLPFDIVTGNSKSYPMIVKDVIQHGHKFFSLQTPFYYKTRFRKGQMFFFELSNSTHKLIVKGSVKLNKYNALLADYIEYTELIDENSKKIVNIVDNHERLLINQKDIENDNKKKRLAGHKDDVQEKRQPHKNNIQELNVKEDNQTFNINDNDTVIRSKWTKLFLFLKYNVKEILFVSCFFSCFFVLGLCLGFFLTVNKYV